MLALVVWMFVQMRRALTGRGRWLVTPVLVVLAAASIGATFENVALVRDQDAYPAPGETYQVGDHRLHLDCRGQGGPTVVLFNGLGEISASWARITDQVGTSHPGLCLRPRRTGLERGRRDSPGRRHRRRRTCTSCSPRPARQGPYVLVGHSIGGPYALTYAAQYPEQVAGMVLLDSSSPEQLTNIPSYAGQYAMMRRGLALLPTLRPAGSRPVVRRLAPPGEAGDQVRAMTSTAARAQERARRDLDDPRGLRPGSGPHHARRPPARRAHRLRVARHDRLGRRAGQARGALGQPACTATSTRPTPASSRTSTAPLSRCRAITEVVSAVRTGTPMATP